MIKQLLEGRNEVTRLDLQKKKILNKIKNKLNNFSFLKSKKNNSNYQMHQMIIKNPLVSIFLKNKN